MRTKIIGTAVAVAVVCVVAWAAIRWWNTHLRDERSFYKGVVAQLEHENDSLRAAHQKSTNETVTIQDTLHRKFVVYDSIRQTVTLTDTSRFVLVDTQFIHVADSTRRVCESLDNSCTRERMAAAARIKNMQEQIDARDKVIANQPGFLQRVQDFSTGAVAGGATGALITYAACKR